MLQLNHRASSGTEITLRCLRELAPSSAFDITSKQVLPLQQSWGHTQLYMPWSQQESVNTPVEVFGRPFWTNWELPALSWHVIVQSERCCVQARGTDCETSQLYVDAKSCKSCVYCLTLSPSHRGGARKTRGERKSVSSLPHNRHLQWCLFRMTSAQLIDL